MGKFVDFASLKEAVTIEQVLEMLGIKLKLANNGQLRGCCPIHQGEDERQFVVTPLKNMFYCFGGCGGGDIIKLVSKMKTLELKEAAEHIEKHFRLGNSTVDTKAKKAVVTVDTGLKPLDYLQADHEAVEAVGFDQETAKALGIGYAAKGLMRGMVAVPIRLEDGTLTGYIGIVEAKLPPKFHLSSNVVPIKKSA